MKRSSVSAAFGAVLIVIALCSPAGPASAASAGVAGWSNPTTTSDGRVLARLLDASGNTIATAGWNPSSTQIQPLDAFGCDNWYNQNVCIDLYGSGLHIDQWNTTAFGNWGCSTAYDQINGSSIHNSPRICPSSGSSGVYYFYWTANRNFHDGDQACNQWSGAWGRPCEWIEK